MPPPGYSGKTVAAKLGLTENTRLLLVNAPEHYEALINVNFKIRYAGKNEIPDIIHVFSRNNKEFEQSMNALRAIIKQNPAITIWISWYKKSAGMNSDLTEDLIRKYVLANELVDVKVCAVTEQWSGLKLVVPLAKRK